MEQIARDIPSRREGDDMIADELLEQGCGLTLGRYTLLRKIAVGGMAEVYVARSQGVNGFAKRVALKKILPQYSHNRKFLEMLLDEAKISVSLAHPNIAQVYELGLGAADTHFIVMEYVEGRPLNRVLQRAIERGQPGLPITHAVHVVSEVAKGLDHAHKQLDSKGELLQIVHRDVSPQNVLLSYQGCVKLIDFGIARAEGRAAQTGHGIIKGKLRYLAPEIAAGKEPDFRADIFCCGLVLFELLTGEPMYSPNNDIHALEMARRADVRSPRSVNRAVPEELDTIVMRMLKRDRKERYHSAKDLYADLRMFLNRFDPLFNEGELSDYMQSMFKTEMAEARMLDSLAEKIASNEGRLAEEPTVAVDHWELMLKEQTSSPKLRLVGADGGEAMSVVLAKDRAHSERPLVGDVPGPRTMPRGAMAPPPAKEGLSGASDQPSRSLLVTLDEPERSEEVSISFTDDNLRSGSDSEIGPLVDELDAADTSKTGAPVAAQKPVVQVPTATIELEEAQKLGLLVEPLPKLPVPKSRTLFRARAVAAPRIGTPPPEDEPRPGRAIALLAGATIVVSLACLLISALVTSPSGAREAIAATPPVEETAPVVLVQQALVEQAAIVVDTPPPADKEPIRLKSYDDAAAAAAKNEASEDDAPAIAVEDPEPGDEEPDRIRPDRPHRISGGTVLVNSRPVSTIYVDGKKIGRTPKVVIVKPGRHDISLEGPTGQQKTFTRKITAGKNGPVTWRWR